MPKTHPRSRIGASRPLAFVTAVLVMLSGLLATPAAQAVPAPSATAAVASATPGQLAVHVDFFGIAPSELPAPQNDGVYVALIDRETSVPVNTVHVGSDAIVDGAGSADFSVTDEQGLDRARPYDLLIWYAHGDPTAEATVLRQEFPISEEQWDAVFPPAPTPQETRLTIAASAASVKLGESVTLTATVAPAAAGTVTFADAKGEVGRAEIVAGGDTTVLTLTPAALGQHHYTASFAPANPDEFAGSTTADATLVVVTEAKDPPTDPQPPVDPDPPIADGGVLQWGVLKRFIDYVEGPIASGKVTVTAPAARKGDSFTFPQNSDKGWNEGTETGTLNYAGALHFTGHDGVLDLTFANPEIVVKSASRAELAVTSDGKRLVLAVLDLSKAKRSELKGGAIRWSGTPATLTASGAPVFLDFYSAGQELDPVTFVAGAPEEVDPVVPPKKPEKPKTDKPKTEKPEKPAEKKRDSNSREAGSLAWGISSGFAGYTIGSIAKGTISTEGVGRSGGRYLFPQATGGDWNFERQTGTIRYSGVVAFLGHKVAGTYLMNESFANPVITVRNASSGSISAGGRTFGLDLAGASKTVAESGAVTWSGVPVIGDISGGGSNGSSSGGGSFGLDPLTFTVGAANATDFGSTTQSNPTEGREPAAEAPATTGITLLTPADELVAGGEIEFEAAGFQPDERDVFVVIYSEPVLLDRHAGADANGVVRWAGTVPEDLHGEHTITAQGSIDVGSVIDIMTAEEYEALHEVQQLAEQGTVAETPQAAGIGGAPAAPGGDANHWGVWAGSIGLLVIAAGMTALVVRQRRNAA